jgi:hypothetical protein
LTRDITTQKNKDAHERFGALPVFPSQYPKINAGIANKKPTPNGLRYLRWGGDGEAKLSNWKNDKA